MLESEGIGRPSTYASIIGTIIDRGYAQLNGNALIPTFTAFAVTGLLEKYFPNLVDTSFTSQMEHTLDEISTGEADWLPYLQKFYLGEKGLETQVKEQESQIDPNEARTVELENLDAKVRIGRFGAYLEAENGDGIVKASIPKDLTPSELDPEQVEVLLRQKTEGPDKLGFHPETGEPIYILIGPYGPYVRLGDVSEDNKKPKQASLPKGVTMDTVTLEMAVGLLALPRTLGTHPATGGRIQASLGRFGPYVVHDQGKGEKEYRSLKAGDDVLTITLERALELLSEPKKGRGAGKSKKALRELGAHPKDNEPVNIYDGPYGPYVKHGKTNVSLPEGQSVEDITMETAVELLAAKASTKKSTSKSSKSTSSTKKKSTGTSSSSRKTIAKKTTASTGTKKKSSTRSTSS
jgi:DNA topoisomerase-1